MPPIDVKSAQGIAFLNVIIYNSVSGNQILHTGCHQRVEDVLLLIEVTVLVDRSRALFLGAYVPFSCFPVNIKV